MNRISMGNGIKIIQNSMVRLANNGLGGDNRVSLCSGIDQAGDVVFFAETNGGYVVAPCLEDDPAEIKDFSGIVTPEMARNAAKRYREIFGWSDDGVIEYLRDLRDIIAQTEEQ